MLEKRHILKEFYFILEKNIKFEKFMIELQKWIGWNKKKKDELLLLLLLQLVFGEITISILLILQDMLILQLK
jgi:hypothetical protein